MKTEFQFKAVTSLAADRIAKHYGVPVVWRDLPEGVTGDLDGCEIILDTKNDPEAELYTVLHLFGHTVQWNTDPKLSELGHEQQVMTTPEKLGQIHDYERDASRIGVSLLEEIGREDMREWMSRFFAADWRFLDTLYRTGTHVPIEIDWDCPVDLLEPLPVPDFRLHHCDHRQAFE